MEVRWFWKNIFRDKAFRRFYEKIKKIYKRQHLRAYLRKVCKLRLHVTQNASQWSFFFSFSFSLSSVLLHGLTKAICLFLIYFCFSLVWPISDLFAWHDVCFKVMSVRDKQLMTDLRKSMWDLALWVPLPAARRRESTDFIKILIPNHKLTCEEVQSDFIYLLYIWSELLCCEFPS